MTIDIDNYDIVQFNDIDYDERLQILKRTSVQKIHRWFWDNFLEARNFYLKQNVEFSKEQIQNGTIKTSKGKYIEYLAKSRNAQVKRLYRDFDHWLSVREKALNDDERNKSSIAIGISILALIISIVGTIPSLLELYYILF